MQRSRHYSLGGGVAAMEQDKHGEHSKQGKPVKYGDSDHHDKYRQYKQAFAGAALPFAFLDMDILRSNIGAILQRSAGKHIRIASKSIRSVGVLQHIMQQSPQFIGIMCYSAHEAALLAERGFDDLLLGYPVWDAEAVKTAAQWIARGKRIIFMVDDRKQVEHLEALAQANDVVLPLCLDVDMSADYYGIHFGVWRSPVRSVSAALELAQRIASSKHVSLDGIMGYEAQVAGVGDAVPGKALKNALVRHMKRRSVAELAALRAEIVARLAELGIPLRFVNGGGTGSMATTCAEPAVTEVTVGSGFYSPALFDNYRDFRFGPAAGYAIEIVRQPKPDVYTCYGGGYIGSGAVGADKLPQPYLPAGAKLLSLEGAGEVQTPIHYRGEVPLGLGDPIFMRHSKAGELCERFQTIHCYSDGRETGEMKTYRGEGWCFV